MAQQEMLSPCASLVTRVPSSEPTAEGENQLHACLLIATQAPLAHMYPPRNASLTYNINNN